MSQLTFVVGDTAPSVVGTLTDAAGVAINLTTCTVRFQMRLVNDARFTVDASATVTSTTGGLVRYDWSAVLTGIITNSVLTTVTTNGLSADVWHAVNAAVNARAGATECGTYLNLTKTSTAGTLYWAFTLTYRLIGT